MTALDYVIDSTYKFNPNGTIVNQSSGARENSTQIIILMTDGKITSYDLWNNHLALTSGRLNELGIIRYTIGIGNNIDDNELKMMSSEPTNLYTFKISDYSDLAGGLSRLLRKKTCRQSTMIDGGHGDNKDNNLISVGIQKCQSKSYHLTCSRQGSRRLGSSTTTSSRNSRISEQKQEDFENFHRYANESDRYPIQQKRRRRRKRRSSSGSSCSILFYMKSTVPSGYVDEEGMTRGCGITYVILFI